jgi:lipopolysaccharide transport system permease protein
MAAAVLFFLFSNLLEVDTQGISFLSFTFSGLLLWNYFSFVLSQSASSLIASQSMLQKIYFPRILFLVIAFADGQIKAWGLLSFVPLLIATLAAAWGTGLWLSALSIRFRDLQQALPFLLQMLFFISPIAYSPALVQERIPIEWQSVYYLNPINGILELFRSAIFGLEHHPQAWLSIGVSLLLLMSGWWYFHKVERKIADLI